MPRETWEVRPSGVTGEADTSFFARIGAVNNALTAVANAIRVGEHIVARLA